MKIISIGDLLKSGYPSLHHFRNDFLVTDRLDSLRPLMRPAVLEGTAVFVCLGGSIDCTINSQPLHIEKNSMLMVFSGDVVRIDAFNAMEGYAAMISDSFLNEIDITFSQRSAFFSDMRPNALSEVDDDVINQFKPFYYLINAILCDRPRPYDLEPIVKELVFAFCHAIFGVVAEMRGKKAAAGKRSRAREIFDNFIALLNQHHCQEHSVAFYASKLGISPKYLSFAVKTFSQRGALDWINEYVMIEARSMLRDTEMSIKEIAYKLNFPTQSAFGKFFFQKQGIGPKEYRYQS